MNGVDVMLIVLLIGAFGWIGGRASRAGRIELLKEQRDKAVGELRALRETHGLTALDLRRELRRFERHAGIAKERSRRVP